MSSDVVGLIGAPIEINSTSQFDEATLTFTYDDTLLGETLEEDLAVLWYDEENNWYEIFDEESIIDTENNTVSYTTTHFSTYMVVNKQQWYDVWSSALTYGRNSNDISEVPTTYFDISYVIDRSGSMRGTKIASAKEAINSFVDAMYSSDRANIVTSNSSAHLVCDFTSDKTDLHNFISNIYPSGGTSVNAGLIKSLDAFENNPSSNSKIIVLLCDGDVNCTQTTIDRANEYNIDIYTVLIGSTSGQSKLQKIAEQTGGKFYYAQSAEEIREAIFGVQEDTIGEIDTTDTDGDGLYDIYETAGMIIPNGRYITTDPMDFDSDDDGLSDGKEMGIIENFDEQSWLKQSTMTIRGFDSDIYVEYFDYKCDPNEEDTDGDMLTDNEEYFLDVFTGDWGFVSDPLKIDTDNDGYKDYYDPEPLFYNTNIYDREKVVEYAIKWAENNDLSVYNEKYPYFEERGDCTNFVSQCIYAGGYPMTEKWFIYNREKTEPNKFLNYFSGYFYDVRYYDTFVYSTAWSSVDEFYSLFSKLEYCEKETEILTKDYIENSISHWIKEGDVIIFNSDTIDHAAIITKVTDDEILFSGHTYPRENYNLYKVMDKYGQGITILHIRDELHEQEWYDYV